jgi:hypothetical protein
MKCSRDFLVCAALQTAMIAHHTCHGGYNRIPGLSSRFRSQNFGVGGAISRSRDWLDWMQPEAWNLEVSLVITLCMCES